MASQYSRIKRATSEFKNFLEYYRDEYDGAYENIRPRQGWNIPYKSDFIFQFLENMHGNMYEGIHPRLFDDDLTPDEEILKRWTSLLSYLESQEAEFADIAKHSDEGVLDVVTSTVYELAQRLIYKLREVIRLASVDMAEASKKEVNVNPVVVPAVENPIRLIGIVTATIEEERAVRDLLFNEQISPYSAQDSNVYYSGDFQKGERSIPVVLVRAHHQGVSSATNTTTKMLLKYQPSFMVMLGHAAGNKNMPNTNLGNILIAKESVDYHQVEIVQKDSQEGDAEFVEKDKKYSISINVGLQGRLESYMQNKAVLNFVKQSYPDNNLFEKEITCRSGKFVTGGVLMRSEERFKEILTQNPGTIGLDMETHGFYYACENTASANKPFFVSIKSVSDFGDHNTAHPKPLKPALVRQQFAAFTSANFFHEFIFANY